MYKTAEHVGKKCAGVLVFLGAVVLACREVIRNPKRLRKRDFFYYADLCGTRSLPIVLLICFLMGVILGFQAAVQMVKFGTEIFVADLVGFTVLKELGPLMVAMICTGRAGSAFSAEIGTMKTDDEANALYTMGISPERFLVVPKLLAMVTVMPLLTIFGDTAGLAGGLAVGTLGLGIPMAAYLERSAAALEYSSLLLGVLKSFFFAVIITFCGCYAGFRAAPNAQGVGRSATSAVVTSIFWVIIADALLTFVYSLWGY